ncbi:GYD domain-containing protein [Benzoatithermus flavus]|uniref:GYD domain-containing protein n=1 Tax=Benzoatithermus flavus TaxID=3108223 RepID=A0ABU8XWJ0_9PROT
MPTYVALANYTEKGMQNVRDSPRRLDAVRQHLREMGGDIVSFYLTLGEHDIVFVYEAPDDAISARFLLLLGAAGFVRTKTMKAFPEAAYREIIASLG